MGNQLARTAQVNPSDYYLHEVPNLVYKRTLGGGRFLKTVQCVHDEGLVVVKVYFKRGEADLKRYERQLVDTQRQLLGMKHAHAVPFQKYVETDKAVYLLRQFFFSNLSDRLSTRPFLSTVEKMWIMFQLLVAMSEIHSLGICHGDIKCENVLVTSFNWVALTDFATFKPTYLPGDNPADFSFFFDTGSRRRCYVAPERFFEPSSPQQAEARLLPSMDVFSMGCVIAELFMEGQALFDLSQLLAYRKGQYDPSVAIAKVEVPQVREMVSHMVQLDAGARLSAREYLAKWGPALFPRFFSPYLHELVSELLPMEPDLQITTLQRTYDSVKARMRSEGAPAFSMAQVYAFLRSNAGKSAGEKSKRHQHRLLAPSGALALDGGAASDGGSDGGISPTDSKDKGAAASSKEAAPASEPQPAATAAPGADAAGGSGTEGAAARLHVHTHVHGHGHGHGNGQGHAGGLGYISGVLETVTEEMYEHQARERWGPFVDYCGSGGDAPADVAAAIGAVKVKHKEAISLPADGGWRWVTPWLLDISASKHLEGARACDGRSPTTSAVATITGASQADTAGSELDALAASIPCDAEGWSYRLPTGGWGPMCASDCSWRRRRWIRRRCRLSSYQQTRSMAIEAAAARASLQAEAMGGRAADDLAVGTGASAGLRDASDWDKRGAAGWGKASGMPSLASQGSLGSHSILLSTGDDRIDVPVIAPSEGAGEQVPGLALVAAILCSLVRNIKLPHLRCGAVVLLKNAAGYCDDDVRLQRIVPYLVSLLPDASAVVRVEAVHALAHVLSLVETFPPSDAKIFQEYVFPALSLLPNDTEEVVRMAYAANIAPLAASSLRFLMQSQYMTQVALSGIASSRLMRGENSSIPLQEFRYDVEVAALRASVTHVVQELVTGARSSPTVRRTLCHSVSSLCLFLGRRLSNDFLLPLLISFLNDRDPQLRAAFFKNIAQVGEFVGQGSLEQFLMPCIEQALTDSEEHVVVNALNCLGTLADRGLLKKRVLLSAVTRGVFLLRHARYCVRVCAAGFLRAAAHALTTPEVYALLRPLAAPHLDLPKRPHAAIALLLSEETILGALKPAWSKSELSDAIRAGSNRKASVSRDRGGPRRSISASAAPPDHGHARAHSVGAPLSPTRGRSALDVAQGAPADGKGGASSTAAGSKFTRSRTTAFHDLDPFGGNLGMPARGPEAQHDDKTAGDLSMLAGPMGLAYRMGAGASTSSIMDQWRAVQQQDAGQGGSVQGPGGGGEAQVDEYGRTVQGTLGPSEASSGMTPEARSRPPVHDGDVASTDFAFMSPVGPLASPASHETRVTGASPGGQTQTDAREDRGGAVAAAAATNSSYAAGALRRLRLGDKEDDVGDLFGPGPWKVGDGSVGKGNAAAGQGGGATPAAAATVGAVGAGGGGTSTPSASVSATSTPTPTPLAPNPTITAATPAPGGHGAGGGLSSTPLHRRHRSTGSAGGEEGSSTTSSLDGSPRGSMVMYQEGGDTWQPRGVLLAHLQEHHKAVNEIAISSDNAFFLSGSDDGNVKVWDLRRLERDVSFRSQATHVAAGGGKVNSIAMLEGTHCFASASSRGYLHVVRVDYIPRTKGIHDRYTGATEVKTMDREEGEVLWVRSGASMGQTGSQLLIYCTQRGGVQAWDLRTDALHQGPTWRLPFSPQHGLLHKVAFDPLQERTWMVTGSTRGNLCLWDMRFQIPVCTWAHPAGVPINALAAVQPGMPRPSSSSSLSAMFPPGGQAWGVAARAGVPAAGNHPLRSRWCTRPQGATRSLYGTGRTGRASRSFGCWGRRWRARRSVAGATTPWPSASARSLRRCSPSRAPPRLGALQARPRLRSRTCSSAWTSCARRRHAPRASARCCRSVAGSAC